MGKRKSRAKPAPTKRMDKLDTIFSCPFCNHGSSVECIIDMKHLIGKAACRICEESFSTTITALTEAIDIYSEWIDECERVNTAEDDVVQEEEEEVEEEEEDMFEDAVCTTQARVNTPLSVITEAFEDLADLVKPQRSDEIDEDELRLDDFCSACTHVSVLFNCLGFAFKFAEMEYIAKVKDLVEASKTFETLHNILDLDVEKETVKTPGSHSRNLRRVRQGLDLIRAIFEQFLIADDYSLKDAATTAYTEVCAPFHTWAVRTAVYAGMYTLPTRDQLLLRLNETDQSVEKNMRRYMEASRPIIEYIDKLYIERNIKLDW